MGGMRPSTQHELNMKNFNFRVNQTEESENRVEPSPTIQLSAGISENSSWPGALPLPAASFTIDIATVLKISSVKQFTHFASGCMKYSGTFRLNVAAFAYKSY
ncbi:hypothetical protein NPIL_96921 [Nephila pilipes]|uniref:Uncharacterized protein n=1 Tax=Nephila pilipes TaxID=299642 RepID=A0A8X6PPQ2_NEPPI|nr:hypothetical protein NPIL_96921 [Nephila pilipes]